MTNDLLIDLGLSPGLPQTRDLPDVLVALWEDPAVVALWLGGSLACGQADRYSDIDLRIAVHPGEFIPDQLPKGAALLQEEAVACLRTPRGEDATQFQVLLGDGTLYDLIVQATTHRPLDEVRRVLACRDSEFAPCLEGGEDPSVTFPIAEAMVVERLIDEFWIAQYKHRKVLVRGLALVAWEGEHYLRRCLMRLWYILATGHDCGAQAGTIHSLSPVSRAIVASRGDAALGMLGEPLRTEEEFRVGMTRLQDEVAIASRELAAQLGFSYPEAAERVARDAWADYDMGRK